MYVSCRPMSCRNSLIGLSLLLRCERYSPCTGESTGERGEDRQVGMERDSIQAPNAKREQRPLVFEPPELTLDGGTARVELPPAGS